MTTSSIGSENPTTADPAAVDAQGSQTLTEAANGKSRGWLTIPRMLVQSRPMLMLALIVVLILAMTITQGDRFATTANYQAILLNASVRGILVTGMMILFIAGVFDLSIGSTLALSGVTAGVLITEFGFSAPLGAIAGLTIGALAGLINGLLVTRVRINALIVTLATLSVFQGVTQLISGTGVSRIGDSFAVFGQARLLGLQSPFWVMLIVVALGSFAITRTRIFRQFYYVGGNPEAARLSGIRNDRIILGGFILMGVLAGLAGVLNAARLNAALVSAGTGLELQVITAAVLGGASLKGGEGTVIGGVLGVLFIALVQNALIILGVDVFWQNIAIGSALIFAVSLDSLKQRQKRE